MNQKRKALGALCVLLLCACGPLRTMAQFHGGFPLGTIEMQHTTVVPFAQLGNRIYVRIGIRGISYAFMFDTGGSGILTPEVQSALKFAVLAQARVVGVGSVGQDVPIVRVPAISLGAISYRDGAFIVLKLPTESDPIPGTHFGGVIGREIFGQLVTTIDYKTHTLTLYAPGTFKAEGAADVLPLAIRDGHPNVPASVNGNVGNFDVDTGDGSAVTLSPAFDQKAHVDRSFAKRVHVVVGRGTGGIMMGVAGRVKSFDLASTHLSDEVVMVAEGGGIYDNPALDGNLGGELLRRFRITIDEGSKKLYLTKNATFGQPQRFNRAGFYSVRTAGGEKVIFVVPQGPAEKSGLRAGDVILKIGARRVVDLLHEQFAERLTNEAPNYLRISVLREGRSNPISLTLTMQDLL